MRIYIVRCICIFSEQAVAHPSINDSCIISYIKIMVKTVIINVDFQKQQSYNKDIGMCVSAAREIRGRRLQASIISARK